MKRLLPAVLSVALLGSCSTIASWNEGCPGVYSGVKYNEEQRAELAPLSEELDEQWLFTYIDLPFSAVLDTLTLPVSYFAQDWAEPRPTGAPGCNWCAEEQERTAAAEAH